MSNLTPRQQAILQAITEGRALRFETKTVIYDTVRAASEALVEAWDSDRKAETVRI